MQRLWGSKISDLAFGEFLQILQWVAAKKGKQLVFIDQWYPSSKTCSHCGHVLESLDLSVREWRCQTVPDCNCCLSLESHAVSPSGRTSCTPVGVCQGDRSSVTGPSLTMVTSIVAPNLPVSTRKPLQRN